MGVADCLINIMALNILFLELCQHDRRELSVNECCVTYSSTCILKIDSYVCGTMMAQQQSLLYRIRAQTNIRINIRFAIIRILKQATNYSFVVFNSIYWTS